VGVDLQTKRVPIALGGINKELDPARMKGMYTPYMKNMMIEHGRLRKFRGYELLLTPANNANNLQALEGSEEGAGIVSYIDAQGMVHLIALTTLHAFTYSIGSESSWYCATPGIELTLELSSIGNQWTDSHANLVLDDELGGILSITGTTSADSDKIGYDNFTSVDLTGYTHITGWIWRGTAAALSADLKLVISESADGAKAGDYVEVDIPDPGVQGQWRFFSVAVDLSSMNAAVSAAIWNNNIAWSSQNIEILNIRAVVPFSGDAEDKFNDAIATDTSEFSNNGGSALVLTNNKDDVVYYEGSNSGVPFYPDDTFQTLVHTFPTFIRCRDIVEFWNHLMFISYTLTGPVTHAKSIAHSAAGDVDDHASSSSGTYTLFDSVGEMLRVFKIGGSLVIFSSKSITVGDYFGSITKFTFPTINTDLGLFGERAVCRVGDILFFVGSDRRFYYYTVGTKPTEIGRAVSEDFMDNITSEPNDILVGYISTSRRVLFVDSSSGKAYAYNLNTKEFPWEYLEWINNPIAFTEWPAGSYFQGYLDTPFIDENCKVFTVTEPDTSSGTNGHYQMGGKASVNTAGTDITCEYQTEDITLNDEYEYCRWQEFTFTAKSALASASVIVEYSIDNGTTWVSTHPTTIYLENNKWKTYKVTFDVVSRKIRMRFTQTAKDLQIKDDMFIGLLPELVDEDEVE
jgi:hypothetical protein